MLRLLVSRLLGRNRPTAAPTDSTSEPDAPEAYRAEVARRVLAGEADAVVDLMRSGELGWDAVFGMGDFVLMEVYRPWFDPDSSLQFPNPSEVVGGVEFFDQVLTRSRNQHRVLRHDCPMSRQIGIADVTSGEIVFTSIHGVKSLCSPDNPGYAVYKQLPSSRMVARLPRNLAG